MNSEIRMDRLTERREITVDEAIAIALEYLQQGRVGEAAMVCAKVLELEPGHPDALHYSGVIAHKQGRNDEALALIGQSLERAPNQPDWYSNLGIVLQGMDRLEAAIEA